MTKFLSGLVIGLLAAGVGLHFFRDSLTVDPTASTTMIEVDTQGGTTQETSPATVVPATVVLELQKSPQGQWTIVENSAVNAGLDIGLLSSLNLQLNPADKKTPAGPNNSSLPSALESEARSPRETKTANNVGSVGNTLPLTDDHLIMLERSRENEKPARTPHGIHDLIEAEPRDDAWAYYVEAQIQAYLDKTAIPQGIEVPIIQCRSTWCEIQAFLYGESQRKNWHNLLSGMSSEAFWIEFSGTSTYSTSVNDNKSATFVFLERKQADE